MIAPMNEHLLARIADMRSVFLELAASHGTPLYVFDPSEVQSHLQAFRGAFERAGCPADVFYAIKSNFYPGLLRTIVEEESFLDASSVRELHLALAAGAKRILFSGPAKGERECALILEHADRITVHLESLRELRLLGRMAAERKTPVRCGVRIATSHQGRWSKFGVPLAELRSFLDAMREYPLLRFAGIHFHMSFNKNPGVYVDTLREIGAYAKTNLSPSERASVEFIDVGGGFWPSDTMEAAYPWNPDMRQAEVDEKTVSDILADNIQPRSIPLEVTPIEGFANAIAGAMRDFIHPLCPNATIWTEPGRFLSQNAMHILLTLKDLKSEQKGIADGGNNMIGWEKFQYYYYAPLFDLTNFSMEREVPFLLYGSLCTPDDIWGYYLYCTDIRENDVILLPFQGAYTFGLSQEFIRGVPTVLDLPAVQSVGMGKARKPRRRSTV